MIFVIFIVYIVMGLVDVLISMTDGRLVKSREEEVLYVIFLL